MYTPMATFYLTGVTETPDIFLPKSETGQNFLNH